MCTKLIPDKNKEKKNRNKRKKKKINKANEMLKWRRRKKKKTLRIKRRRRRNNRSQQWIQCYIDWELFWVCDVISVVVAVEIVKKKSKKRKTFKWDTNRTYFSLVDAKRKKYIDKTQTNQLKIHCSVWPGITIPIFCCCLFSFKRKRLNSSKEK